MPLHLEVLHYDNNGDPLALNADLEWGWRTRFDTLGLVADLGGGRTLRAQGLTGRTRMGPVEGAAHWIDMRFRAAYGKLTQRFGRSAVAARVDVFSTRNRGSKVDVTDDEDGWAVTAAARHEISPQLTALVEYLHVASDRAARVRQALAAEQTQNQVQLVMRAHW
jgi:hypothetical protein